MSADSPTGDDTPSSGGGILVPRWVTLQIPIGGLKFTVGDQGIQAEPVVFEVSLDTWPHWLEIAFRHYRGARDAHRRLLEGRDNQDGPVIDEALNSEFQSAMQCVCCCAFALDGLYASIKSQLPAPAAVAQGLQAGHTSRAGHIVQVLLRFAKLTNSQAKAMRRHVGDVFKFRDWAVHPPYEFRRPLLHPDLNAGVDWRFVAFSEENSRNAMSITLETLLRTFENPRSVPAEFAAWAATRLEILKSIIANAEATVSWVPNEAP